MSKKLLLILITAFLDLLGFGILLPSLPSLTLHFGMIASWTIWSQSVYSLGMFVSGGLIWTLSDKYGRKKILLITSSFNILAYILIGIAYFLVGHIETIFAYALFIFARFIGWVGWSGISVIQAYVSDISTPVEKTKNMWMIGAMFGLAFLVWPAIWGILSVYGWIEQILTVTTIIMIINTLYIYFKLPEPVKHSHDIPDTKHLHYSPFLLFLFCASLIVTIAFSSIQWGSMQFYHDVFHFSPKEIWFFMSMVGLASIIYQWLLVKYVRRIFSDGSMMIFGITLLAVCIYLFGTNRDPIFLYPIVMLIPVGMGSFNPSLMSLLGQNSEKHVGKVMGINSSVVGIGGIIWPIVIGILYAKDPSFPFIWASILLFFLLLIALFFLAWNTRKSKKTETEKIL